MSEYTPGPWSIGNANIKHEAEVGIHGPGEYGFIICDLQSDGYDEKTQKANAALIAAAPDLLEALEAMQKSAPSSCCADFHHAHSDRHGPDESCPALDRWEAACLGARVAIAKARSAS